MASFLDKFNKKNKRKKAAEEVTDEHEIGSAEDIDEDQEDDTQDNLQIDVEEEGEELQKKSGNKKSSSVLIKTIVVIGIIYLAADEFGLLKQFEQAPPPVVAKKKEAKQNENKPLEETKDQPSTVETPFNNESQETIEPDKVSEPDKATEVDKTIENEKTSEIAVKATEETIQDTITPTNPEPGIASNEPKAIEPSAQIEEVEIDAAVSETQKTSPAIEDVNLGEKEKVESKEESKEVKNTIGEVSPEKEIVEVKDKTREEFQDNSVEKIDMLKSASYQSPPDYELSGRGLVYNCLGGHWACVNQTSYNTCLDNQKWQKNNKKSAECAVSEVLLTFEDCKKLQLHKINQNQSTPCF